MPDDLALQIEPLHELVRAHGWPLLMVEGVEADDVIGTLARQAKAAGIDTMISTSDKDLAQLVEPGVTLVNTMTNETLDHDGVVAKFGVRPDQVVDLLALTGDAIDNVPGVAKVGPKTAAKWLAQYGSLDKLIERAHEIGGVVGENLRNALDWLPQGRRLLTVKVDCELPSQVADLTLGRAGRSTRCARCTSASSSRAGCAISDARDVERARSRPKPRGVGATLGRKLSTPPRDTALAAVDYETVLTSARRSSAGSRRSKPPTSSAFDIETTSADPMTARDRRHLARDRAPRTRRYIPLDHRYAGAPAQLDRRDGARRASRRGSPIAARAKLGTEPQVRRARARQSRHRACAASRTTRCSNRTCSSRTSRTTCDNLALAPSRRRDARLRRR